MKDAKILLFSLILASLASCSGPSASSSTSPSSSPSSPSSSPSSPSSSTTSLSSSSEQTPSITFSEVKNLDIYSPDYENGLAPIVSGTISCGFSSYYGNEEAYFSLNDVLDEVSDFTDLKNPFVGTLIDGEVVNYTGGKDYDVTFSVDASNNLITFPDYPSYISMDSGSKGDFGWTTRINKLSLIEGKEEYVNGGETVFDLGRYSIDIVMHEGNIYLPSAIARYIFLDVIGISLIYNGNAVYRPTDQEDIYNGGLTAFGEAYYSSPFKDMEQKGENAATLHGNETMFYLDYYYGFKDDEKYGGNLFSSYLEEHYPSEFALFYSRKKDDVERVYEWLLHAYFDDLHSTAPWNMGSLYAGYEFANEYASTPRYDEYMNRYMELFDLREKALGISSDAGSGSLDEMLSIEGDMAVIRFDSFLWDNQVVVTDEPSYYRQHMYEDLYSLFAYSFLTIEGKGIKKVVLDITLNGGGYSEACLEAFSFLVNEVNSSLYYVMNGSSSGLSFKGILPSGRTTSYAGEYDFYVMTSLCTFSSANLMATMAKNAGIKLIGEKSGGGACMVGFFYTPEGQAARISSSIRIPLTSGKAHNDAGISPDINLDDSYFYDLPKLSTKLDEIAAN